MKTIIISTLVAVVLVGGGIWLFGGEDTTSNDQTVNNVKIVDGVQVVSIAAKGGYSPRITAAKADTPTKIRVTTKGTFDCSSALVIPSIGYREILVPTGTTEIDIPALKAGSKLVGLCAMGMYSFAIDFSS